VCDEDLCQALAQRQLFSGFEFASVQGLQGLMEILMHSYLCF